MIIRPIWSVLLLFAASGVSALAAVSPPAGFVALYNGHDLTGWQGGDRFDHRKWLALPPDDRARLDAEWTTEMRRHWRADGDGLVNDGEGNHATTKTDYGDIELLADYKAGSIEDLGLLLRGCPVGPVGRSHEPAKYSEWNHLRLVMIGCRVSVWLNGKQVIEHTLLENGDNRATPLPPRGPIELSAHPGGIQWRNLFVREIGGAEANRLLAHEGEDPGFQPIFNGHDFSGWDGALDAYEIADHALVTKPKTHRTIYTREQFADFIVRLEFKLPPGGNSGLGLRYPGTGEGAYTGMCECQVLDDHYEQVTGQKIDPRQAHGSAYGMIAAARGYQRPIGEWNFEEVTVRGSRIRVELNGTVILDGDLAKVTNFMANDRHEGKDRTIGHFALLGHYDPVAFRNLRIKRL